MDKRFSEKGYVNRTALLGHTIISVVLLTAYAVELIKGSRTPGYFAVFAILCVAPVVTEFLFYKKDKESPAIKHIIAISYGILYMFVIFTTNSILPFTYVFPMLMVTVLYMDVRLCIVVGAVVFLQNVVYIAYYMVSVGYTSAEIPDVEIRVACVLLTGINMYICTRAVKKVNYAKIQQIQEQTESANALTDNVLETSGRMITGIEDVAQMTVRLGESMEKIHSYMGEVSSGSTETAESVQLQLQKTEQIQQHIIKVKDTAAGIEENMEDTEQKIEIGRQQMEALAGQVEKSMSANRQVLEQMKALGEYASQMNTIIETITSIANSTGMLALNASIEAARAGEAGKGFAVVASQISGLANQTKSATVTIPELIENINKELVAVEAAVDVVTESNRANEESTRVVTENFVGIAQGTENIGGQTKELLDVVEKLGAANADIVENIQTISAITEEVSAHANETYDACEDNAKLVDSVNEIVNTLNSDAQKLQSSR